MPLSAGSTWTCSKEGECFFVSVSNYLKSLSQQKTEFINSTFSSPWAPERWICVSCWVIVPVMFSIPAVTDSLPGSSYKACFRNLPLETYCKHVQALAGNDCMDYSNMDQLFFRALSDLSCPASRFLASADSALWPLVCYQVNVIAVQSSNEEIQVPYLLNNTGCSGITWMSVVAEFGRFFMLPGGWSNTSHSFHEWSKWLESFQEEGGGLSCSSVCRDALQCPHLLAAASI